MPISATGRPSNGKSATTARPSSSTNSACTPRDRSSCAAAGGARTTGFLVVAADDDDAGRGRESGFRERLQRLEQRDQRALVVERAATPHGVVRDHAVERRVLPVAFGALGHRHDVVVREQDDRRARGDRARARCRPACGRRPSRASWPHARRGRWPAARRAGASHSAASFSAGSWWLMVRMRTASARCCAVAAGRWSVHRRSARIPKSPRAWHVAVHTAMTAPARPRPKHPDRDPAAIFIACPVLTNLQPRAFLTVMDRRVKPARAQPAVRGAFGRMSNARGPLVGAMFLMATSAIGPGFITQTTQFTAQLGAAFAFAILVSVLVDVALQLNVWRVIGVSGLRAQELGNRVAPGLGHAARADRGARRVGVQRRQRGGRRAGARCTAGPAAEVGRRRSPQRSPSASSCRGVRAWRWIAWWSCSAS